MSLDDDPANTAQRAAEAAAQTAELKQFIREYVTQEIDKAATRVTKALEASVAKLTEDAQFAAIATLKQTLQVVMLALDNHLGWPAKNIFARVRQELVARGLL